MDIYDYLKMDHKKIAKFFELFKTASSDRNKLEIFALIKKELTIHADSEAETFYKALETFKESEDVALHGEEEHMEIKNKLAEIARFQQVSEEMERLVLELKNTVEHHVADEEGKLFQKAKQILSSDQALILKEQMHAYKEKLSHPTESEKTADIKEL